LSLSDRDVAEKTELAQIVQQLTRGLTILDRIFVSRSVYCTVRVATSFMRSDHRATVACAEQLSQDDDCQNIPSSVSGAARSTCLSVGSAAAMTAHNNISTLSIMQPLNFLTVFILNYQ